MLSSAIAQSQLTTAKADRQRKKRPQELLRTALPCCMRPAVVQAPPSGRAEVPVKMQPPPPPMSTHYVRVDTIRRRLKEALGHRKKKQNWISRKACSKITVGVTTWTKKTSVGHKRSTLRLQGLAGLQQRTRMASQESATTHVDVSGASKKSCAADRHT